MQGHLITIDAESRPVTPEAVKELIDSSTPFWLDLTDLDPETAQTLLRDTFGFHPLAIEDTEDFGQRPKIDSYDGYALMVVFGPTASGHLVEVHCYYTKSYLVTVHRDPFPALRELAGRIRAGTGRRRHHIMLLYRVVDMLVDGFFPVLAQLDDEIDDLEDAILARPTDQQLGRLFDMKRSLIAMRKVVTPERDMFASLLGGGDSLPGMSRETEPYFRDLYDHLIRISDLVDSYRDLLSGALDTHISTVSNRLNVVMKQLTIIATVFLPLSFLTGFFGQNFGWMIGRITSLPAFLLGGLVLPVLVVVALILLFRQRGWLTSTGTVPPAEAAARQRVPSHLRWHVLQTHRSGRPPGR